MTTRCIVVIGHVDHGKTALVRALTGTDTDRLPEEKARGLSIAPGFAHCSYGSDTIDFIDAPGHEDFIAAMVSGTTGAQAALLVVSAAEGIRAQTREHLTIARLLGIGSGVIAVTKSDLLSPSVNSARLAGIRAELSDTPLADAPMILCSALSGAGIEALHAAMETLLAEPAPAHLPLHSYLPVDRAFTLSGQGTIVTGTLLGADLHIDDALTLLPLDRAVTLRSAQSRGQPREIVRAGERIAANLRGISPSDVARGAVLCAPASAAPSHCLDVALDMLPRLDRPLRHMDTLRVLFGTSNEVATVRLYGGTAAQTGFAQLRFEKPVVGYAGQRAILRSLSPPHTIGGAQFLDPDATPARSGDKDRLHLLRATQTRDTLRIAQALSAAHKGVVPVHDAARLSRSTPQAVHEMLHGNYVLLSEALMVATDVLETCKTGILDALSAYHGAHPLRPMAPRSAIAQPRQAPDVVDHALTLLVGARLVHQRGNDIARCDHNAMALLSPQQVTRMAEIEHVFRKSGLSAPRPDSFSQDEDRELIALLKGAGKLVQLHNVALGQMLVLHHDAVAVAARRLGAEFTAPQPFTASEARSALATSRRIIVPLLEYFDHVGITLRTGDHRQMSPTNPVSKFPATC